MLVSSVRHPTGKAISVVMKRFCKPITIPKSTNHLPKKPLTNLYTLQIHIIRLTHASL
ncbi:hypothetical protein Hanom_Chr13g01236301 [Helianthus anomalus]